MTEFREQRGLTWEIRDPIDATTMLGLTWAYGLADEPLAEQGALRIAAEALRVELGRPVELSTGVAVPLVDVDVQPGVLAVWLRGSRETIVAVARRLPSVFGTTTVAEDAPMQPLADAAFPYWPSDLAVRLPGASWPASTLEQPFPDAHRHAEALIRSLDPSNGAHRMLFTSTDAALIPEIEGALRSPARWPAPRVPLRLRPGNTFGGVHGPADELAWSFLLPRSLDGRAAYLVLDTLIRQRISSATNRRIEAASVGVVLAGDLYAIVRTTRPLSIVTRRTLMGQLFINPLPVPDPIIDEAVAVANEQERDTWHRMDALFGTEPSAPATAEGVQKVLANVGRTTHLKLPHTHPESAVDVTPITNDMPFLLPQPPFHADRSYSTRRGNFEGGRPHPQLAGTLAIDGSMLYDATPPLGTGAAVSTSGQVPSEAPNHAVDLDRLAYTMVPPGPNPNGIMLLVDEAQRSLLVAPRLYQRGGKLHGEFAERASRVPMIESTRLLPLVQGVKSEKFLSRYGMWAGIIVVTLAIVGIALLSTIRPGGAFTPLSETLTVGETAEFQYGSRLTVESVTVEQRGNLGEFAIVAVELCAGDDSLPGGDLREADSQRWLSYDNFTLIAGGVEQEAVMLYDGTELISEQVPPTTCKSGTFSYLLSAEPITEVRFENAVEDAVVWRVP